MRRKVIAGNWKMNMLPGDAIKFIDTLTPMVANATTEVVLCVPFTDLFYAINSAQDTNIHIGAQNVHFEESGAYTGEVSAAMLESINCEYVIIGHSERRQYFAETDETVNKKIKAALAHGLRPIVCVGEKLEERESGIATQIITEQTTKALEGLTEDQMKNVIIAYEPIWAIGTGKTATSEDANNSIKDIRARVARDFSQELADETIILYGGSMKPENCVELLNTSDIDGGLIGGASLVPEKFEKMVNYNK